jgi:hypothetical protein
MERFQLHCGPGFAAAAALNIVPAQSIMSPCYDDPNSSACESCKYNCSLEFKECKKHHGTDCTQEFKECYDACFGKLNESRWTL